MGHHDHELGRVTGATLGLGYTFDQVLNVCIMPGGGFDAGKGFCYQFWIVVNNVALEGGNGPGEG